MDCSQCLVCDLSIQCFNSLKKIKKQMMMNSLKCVSWQPLQITTNLWVYFDKKLVESYVDELGVSALVNEADLSDHCIAI